MYKLLLATNDPAVVEAFSAVKWEELGFKQPRVVSTAEEALSSLRVNHADAVAIGLPKEQDDLLVEQLLEKNPMLPIMAVSTKPGVIESYAVELRRLLGRINADVSNDPFSTADLLKECRHEFFRALMDGRATSEEDVLRHLRLIRSKMDPTKPCVVAELEIPADNDFLRGRWQYGSDRLEVALRNIFRRRGARTAHSRLRPARRPHCAARLPDALPRRSGRGRVDYRHPVRSHPRQH